MPQDKKQRGYIDPFLDQPTTIPSPTSTIGGSRGYIDPFLDQPEQPKLDYIDPFLQPSFTANVGARIGEMIGNIPGAQTTLSTISPVLNFISRPVKGVAKFADSLADESIDVFTAAIDGLKEVFADTVFRPNTKQENLSFSDVIRRRSPQFAADNPNSTVLLGFLGDVALDPTSYLGVGTMKSALTVGGKVVAKPFRQTITRAFQDASKVAMVGDKGTIEILEALGTELATPIRIKERNLLKDTRIIDDVTGSPKIVYHGNANDRPDITFGKNRIRYFTEDPAVASTYADQTGKVFPVYLNMKNPAIYEEAAPTSFIDRLRNEGLPVAEGQTLGEVSNAIRNTVDDPLEGQALAVKELKKEGYDGIQFLSDDGGKLHTQYAAFDQKQVINAISGKTTIETVKGGANIGKVSMYTDLLEKQGYNAFVGKRTEEISDFFKELTGDPNLQLAKSIAADETLADLKRFGKERIPEELYTSEVRERVEDRILRLSESVPEVKNTLFQNKGLYLKVGLPFGKQADTLKVLGLETIHNKVKALTTYLDSASSLTRGVSKVLKFPNKVFVRNNVDLPDEVIKIRDDLENYLKYVEDYTERDSIKLFDKQNVEGRELISKALREADDATRIFERDSMVFGNTPNDRQYARIYQDALERNRLDPEQMAIAAKLRQDYAEAAQLEMRAGLLKNNLVNYYPRGYELIGDPDDMAIVTKARYSDVPSDYLAASQRRKYLTNQDAEAAGMQPELDALTLYAQRMLISRRALAINQFRSSIEEMYGALPGSIQATFQKTGILPTTMATAPNIPKAVIDDMRMIGESVYPMRMNEVVRQAIKSFDFLQGFFKKTATTIGQPLAFPVKQLASNTFQAAFLQGAKAFKMLNPLVAFDAFFLAMNRGKPVTSIPQKLLQFINKNLGGQDAIFAERFIMSKITGEEQLLDFAKDFSKRSVYGDKYSGQELTQLIREFNVAKGFDSTGEEFSRKLLRDVDKDKNTYKNVVGELAKYWRHAGMVEDYSRIGVFLNGLGMGYSPRAAAKMVNETLFDYARGLSSAERNFIKRLIPFYSFQRFAIPSVLKTTLRQPGNVATIQKLMGTMEKLLVTGETANPSEQEQFGDSYLISQPGVFTGFDKDGKAGYNVLNNITPLDVINLTVYDKDGNIDIERSIQKSVLAAFTPFLKVPIQALVGKDFFTGQTIEKASSFGNLESGLGKILPDFAKDLLEWETRTNQVTGKTTTYVSPYMGYYAMQFFPPLRTIVKASEDQELNSTSYALFNAMNIILSPVKTKRIDLKAQYEYEQLQALPEINRLRQDIINAAIRGSDTSGTNKAGRNEFEENQEKYQQYIRVLKERLKIKSQSPIRGQGLGVPQTEENAPITPNPAPTPEQFFR